MEFVKTENAPNAIGPYSQAVKVGNILFTSGQIALRPDGSFVDGGIEEQTKQVLKNLEAVLKEAGFSKENVVKATIFLANMEDFNIVNKIYEDFFKSHKPARSTVAVKTLPKNALIEIDFIAIKE